MPIRTHPPIPQTHASIYTTLCPGLCCKMCFLPGAAAQQSVKGAHWATANSAFLEHTPSPAWTTLSPPSPGSPSTATRRARPAWWKLSPQGAVALCTGHSRNPSDSTAHGWREHPSQRPRPWVSAPDPGQQPGSMERCGPHYHPRTVGEGLSGLKDDLEKTLLRF